MNDSTKISVSDLIVVICQSFYDILLGIICIIPIRFCSIIQAL
jgi:hypothetical protein